MLNRHWIVGTLAVLGLALVPAAASAALSPSQQAQLDAAGSNITPQESQRLQRMSERMDRVLTRMMSDGVMLPKEAARFGRLQSRLERKIAKAASTPGTAKLGRLKGKRHKGKRGWKKGSRQGHKAMKRGNCDRRSGKVAGKRRGGKSKGKRLAKRHGF